MSATEAALLAVVPTIKIGRTRALHRYKLEIQGQRVVVLTRCGIDLTDEEFEVTYGIPTCSDCEAIA